MTNNFDSLPVLSFTIPKLKDLQLPYKSWERIQLPTDVLQLVAGDVELLSCYFLLSDTFRSYFKSLGRVYFDTVGDGPEKVKISLLRCGSGSSQVGGARDVVQNALEYLKAKAVFSGGYCGGLRKEKTKLGDVVISAKLTTY